MRAVSNFSSKSQQESKYTYFPLRLIENGSCGNDVVLHFKTNVFIIIWIVSRTVESPQLNERAALTDIFPRPDLLY